jgi:hypothetical protein
MRKRKLGTGGLEVPGCMGMSFGYGPPGDKQQMIKVLGARHPEHLEQRTGR